MQSGGTQMGILPRRTYVWIEDESVDKCYHCHKLFGWYLRRHHCRGCGRIFCYSCSSHTISSIGINTQGLIDSEQYLLDCLRSTKMPRKAYRACEDCMHIYQKIRDLATVVSVLELLPLEITEYYYLRCTNWMWYEACNLFLSRFREIQYNLPNHIFTSFEQSMLLNNVHLLVGHNKLMCQLIKSLSWDTMSFNDLNHYLRLIKSSEQTCHCCALMCCQECQKSLTDSEVIDILLHVRCPAVRQIVIGYLTQDPDLLQLYIPILTDSIRLEDGRRPSDEMTLSLDNLPNGISIGESLYVVRDYLIQLSVEYEHILYKFFWELLVHLEEPQYNSTYRETSELLLERLTMTYGPHSVDDLKNGMKLVNVFSHMLLNADTINQTLMTQMKDHHLEDQLIPIPLKPHLIMDSVDYAHVRVMQSATKPLLIPCQVKDTSFAPKLSQYSFIYKSEDVRKDHIISCVIRVMDHILRSQGLHMHIVSYNILPTSMNGGLIEIVPHSDTLYTIKEKNQSSVLNYILEHNGHVSVNELRDRFIKSTAAYCVMTYLLGIGDRHMDNIMVTHDGRLFHIDYSFVMGFDPKPLAPKMRITADMVDALGGINSPHYQQFEEACTQIYNCLRKHSNLFTNMLSLLTRLGTSQFTMDQLVTEISKRFLPGEYRSQAKVQLLKTINSSQAASTFMDTIHYYYKEGLHLDGWNWYDKAFYLWSYMGSLYKEPH